MHSNQYQHLSDPCTPPPVTPAVQNVSSTGQKRQSGAQIPATGDQNLPGITSQRLEASLTSQKVEGAGGFFSVSETPATTAELPFVAIPPGSAAEDPSFQEHIDGSSEADEEQLAPDSDDAPDDEIDDDGIEDEAEFIPEEEWCFGGEDNDAADIGDSDQPLDDDEEDDDDAIGEHDPTSPDAAWILNMVSRFPFGLYSQSAPAEAPASSSAGGDLHLMPTRPGKSGLNFDPERRYSFSRTLARAISVDGAIVVKLLAVLMGKSRRELGNRKFAQITTTALERLYPWKSRRAWGGTLRTLCEQQVVESSIRWRRSNIDLTRHYSVSAAVLEQAWDSLIYFRAGDARDHGVCGGVLLLNLRHWLGENAKEHGEVRAHAMRPQLLAELLPFSVSTIKRAMKSLSEKGVIEGQWNAKILATEYVIPGFQPDPMLGGMRDSDNGANGEKRSSQESNLEGEHRLKRCSVISTTSEAENENAPALTMGFARLLELNSRYLADYSDEQVQNLANGIAASVSDILNVASPGVLEALRWRSDDERLCWIEAAGAADGFRQELGVIALRSSSDGPSSRGAIHRVGYNMSLAIFKKVDEWRRHNLSESFQSQMRALFASFGEKMADANLPPPEKARLLRQVVSDRSRVGKLVRIHQTDTGTVEKYPLEVTATDHEALTRFFGRNPNWPVRVLFDVIERCTELNEFTGNPGDDTLFYARLGSRKLRSVLCNLDAVISELGMASRVPRLIVVPKDELYPVHQKSRSSSNSTKLHELDCPTASSGSG
jgi:hypothetical protein